MHATLLPRMCSKYGLKYSTHWNINIWIFRGIISCPPKQSQIKFRSAAFSPAFVSNCSFSTSKINLAFRNALSRCMQLIPRPRVNEFIRAASPTRSRRHVPPTPTQVGTSTVHYKLHLASPKVTNSNSSCAVCTAELAWFVCESSCSDVASE